MSGKRKKTTMTQALRDAINKSELSFAALERETGVTRQSIMGFARGERSLRLDMADKLAEYFGFEITRKDN
jgi:plasmid maintenance system antidote protein VapI